MSVVIENIGAVKRVEIPVPDEGGVVVLRGRNGRGKSTAIEAVQAAVAGRGGLPLRDGTSKGIVEGLGVKLSVGKATRASGKLAVETIEGRLSIADLVDPGIKDQVAADAKRVRALVQLSGAKLSISDFATILPSPQSIDAESSDPVALADLVKRQCETMARDSEAARESEAGREKGFREAAGNCPTWSGESPNELQSKLLVAVRELQSLETRKESAEKARANHDKAIAAYERAKAEHGSHDLVALSAKAVEAMGAYTAAEQSVSRIKAELEAAQREAAQCFKDVQRTRDAAANAEKQAKILGEFQAATMAALPAPVEANEIEAAKAEVARLQSSIAAALESAKAKMRIDKAMECARASKEHDKQAKAWRKAAGEVYSVLTKQVSKLGTPLRIDGGRLVLDTVRGQTFFSELSSGERWRLVIDIAVGILGEHALLTIPQEAWEGLDPENRRDINAHARERGVVIITAEASGDEELTAEVEQ